MNLLLCLAILAAVVVISALSWKEPDPLPAS